MAIDSSTPFLLLIVWTMFIDVGISSAIISKRVQDADNVKQLAEFVTIALSKRIKASPPLTLIKIVNAEKEVLAGINNYKMQLELKDERRKNDVFVCDVIVLDQSFTSTRHLTITSDCTPFLAFVHPIIQITTQSSGNTSPDNKVDLSPSEFPILITTIKPVTTTTSESTTTTTTKPTTTTTTNPPYLHANSDDEIVRLIARYAVKNLSSTKQNDLGFYGSFNSFEIIEVKIQHASNSTNYQMVLGLTTADKHGLKDSASLRCEVTVSYQPWSGIRTLSEWKCSPRKTDKLAVKAHRPTPDPDGTPESVLVDPIPHSITRYSPVDVDTADVKGIANFASTFISSYINKGHLSLIKIITAEKKVFIGHNYKLTLELLSGVHSKRLECEVVVCDHPWTKTRSLSVSTCSAAGALVPKIDGLMDVGYLPVGVDANNVKQMAQFATTIISSNMGQLITLVKIIKAGTEIVPRKKYKIILELQTDAGTGNRELTCEVAVFDQPWPYPFKATCRPKQHEATNKKQSDRI